MLTAYDGKQGMEQAKKQPDLIILDIMMPGADGFEVCRAIRDDVVCPIIFLECETVGGRQDQGTYSWGR